MKPKRAVVLDNFFPQPGYIEFRRGHRAYSILNISSVSAGPVETVMAYQAIVPADDRLFACAGGTIFDATSPQDYGTASSVTGLDSDRLQWVNFSTTGANYLYWVNGEDAPQAWDGSNWVTPAITGEDETTFVNIAVHKNRLWFVEKNTLNAAYLDVDSFQGAATAFPLQGVFRNGGYLVAMGTWTIDAGEGMDDHAVFISSQGEVAVYKGIDPSDATDWTLVGVFSIGPPIGYRCLTKVGGDVAIISIDGLLPLSKALLFDRAAVQKITLTERISRAMNDAARLYKNNFGWQIIGYPKGTRAILNVPLQENGGQQQYVMNTINGAWCRFVGQPANCWEVFQDRLFFGGNDGKVYEADVGGIDGTERIVAQVVPAWGNFQMPGILKRFTMIRPLINTDGTISPSILLNTDFVNIDPPIIPSDFETSGALWDAVIWGQFTWPQEEFVLNEWQSVDGVGQWAAVNMKVTGRDTQGSGLWDLGLWDVAEWDIEVWGSAIPATNLKVNAFDLSLESGGIF